VYTRDEDVASGCCVKATDELRSSMLCNGRRAPLGGGRVQQVPADIKDFTAAAGGGWSAGGRDCPNDDKYRYAEDERRVVSDDVDHLGTGESGPAVAAEDRVLLVDCDDTRTATAAPDGGWGWMIVFVSFLCASVVDGMCSVFGVLLPDLVVHFDQSSATVAVAGSLLAGGFLLYG